MNLIIPVTLALGHSAGESALPPALAQIGTSELALIELQGSLEVQGDRRGQTVGKLTIDADGKVCFLTVSRFSKLIMHENLKGKPTLLIGYHLLEGKVVSLSKPLAVLHCAAPSSASGDVMDVDDSAPEPPSYEICAIVRKKLVFSKRPMPMVGLAGGAASAKPSSTVRKK
ncbi:hypothetical protein EWM64_g10441 [Hericium alpestre]|uniref:Uncharacterized protein n=1 Tax=Hericium alpestre TaxID=135208 RepID=A0A4Y9ZIC3_9AGAM|nr:hypothetical protein EWM64_g10441 [Hericium alpestre]